MKHVLVLHAVSATQPTELVNFVAGFGRFATHDVTVEYRNVWRPLSNASARRFDAVFIADDVWRIRSTDAWPEVVDTINHYRAVCTTGFAFVPEVAGSDDSSDASFEDLDFAVVLSPQVTTRDFVSGAYGRVRAGVGGERDPAPPQAIDRLQWRVTPTLFEAIQRMAAMARAGNGLLELIDLARSLKRFIQAFPQITPDIDARILESLWTDIHLPLALEILHATTIDVLREAALAGALTDMIEWLETIHTQAVPDVGLRGWISYEHTLVSATSTDRP